MSPWRTQQSQKSQASDHLARTEDPKYTEAVQDADLPSGLQRSGGVPRKDIDLVSNEVMKSTQNKAWFQISFLFTNIAETWKLTVLSISYFM